MSTGKQMHDDLMTVWDQDDEDIFDKETEKKEYGDLPDGTHTATVSGVKLVEHESFGTIATIEWTIVKGEHSKRKLWPSYFLKDKNSRKYFKICMKDLGHTKETIQDASKIESMMESVVGKAAEIYTKAWKNKKGYTNYNVYVNECLDNVVTDSDLDAPRDLVDETPSFDEQEDFGF